MKISTTEITQELQKYVDKGNEIVIELHGICQKHYEYDRHLSSAFIVEYLVWYRASLEIVETLSNRQSEIFSEIFQNTTSNTKFRDIISCFDSLDKDFRIDDEFLEASLKKHIAFQLGILKSCEYSIFGKINKLRNSISYSIFNSELDEANALNNAGHSRSASVIVGVVMERHIKSVLNTLYPSENFESSNLSKLIDRLRREKLIEIPDMRIIQRIADLRNKSAHHNEIEVSSDDVEISIRDAKRMIDLIQPIRIENLDE